MKKKKKCRHKWEWEVLSCNFNIGWLVCKYCGKELEKDNIAQYVNKLLSENRRFRRDLYRRKKVVKQIKDFKKSMKDRKYF